MAHDVRSTGVRAIRQRFHKRQHLCRGFARADLCNNRAADNSAIGDGGDGAHLRADARDLVTKSKSEYAMFSSKHRI